MAILSLNTFINLVSMVVFGWEKGKKHHWKMPQKALIFTIFP